MQQQATQLSHDDLVTIIQYLIGFIVFMTTLFISMIGILHRSMTKRLDIIELDLKPILTMIKVQAEQIQELREDQKEQDRWLSNHDKRIQAIERHPALNRVI